MLSEGFGMEDCTAARTGAAASPLPPTPRRSSSAAAPSARRLTTGASGDLEQATRLAAALLSQYGMDGEFGLAALSTESLLRGPLAKKTLARINGILSEELKNAVDLLNEHWAALDRLAQTPMQKNKLTGEEIGQLLKG